PSTRGSTSKSPTWQEPSRASSTRSALSWQSRASAPPSSAPPRSRASTSGTRTCPRTCSRPTSSTPSATPSSASRPRTSASTATAGPDIELELYDGLKQIPPYDEDDDIHPRPASVARLNEAIANADAVLFATPEYNSSIPGQLKNAIDCVSRPVATNVLRNKP